MDAPEIAILQANLNNFDQPQDPVKQNIPTTFHRWTDENFPPITGLTPRLQYRIPKYFGWQMFPDYEYYIWLDGGITLLRPDCAEWYLEQLGGNDIAFFAHPQRSSIESEVNYIDDYLQRRKGTKRGQDYIISRYKNGLHKEQLAEIQKYAYPDNRLFASTVFIYRNNFKVQNFMQEWWAQQARYFTCDQVALPYLLWSYTLKVKTFDEPIYKSGYMSLISHHK
jgi:hypothetical protein